VKTFHAFCKRLLHEKHGQLELAHFLPEIIQKDADLLHTGLSDFPKRFRMLENGSPEIEFYLKRAAYYEAVGFDDSVYRLLKEVQSSPEIVPEFDQIVVDEFQDFNPMEVALIEELSKRGDILIVGDDDQAVYDDRSASAKHLRRLFESSDFEKFELPFCGRCTEVIVEATKSLIKSATAHGCFSGRIPKTYECYLDDKEADSQKYPRVIVANCTTGKNLAKYIHGEIQRISEADIAESRTEGKEYPTVLIIGKGHYLRQIAEQLRPRHTQLTYKPISGPPYSIVDAHTHLVPNETSNLGWRILIDLFLESERQRKIIENSVNGSRIVDVLPRDFVARHMRVIELARSVRSKDSEFKNIAPELTELVGRELAGQLSGFLSRIEPSEAMIEKQLPTISLTTFKGSKGLSAGHVFIVGVHDECMPKHNGHITDVEISQFLVALTRTRKQCHILSNDWWAGPRNKDGFIKKFDRSIFLDWIRRELVEDRGNLRAADLR